MASKGAPAQSSAASDAQLRKLLERSEFSHSAYMQANEGKCGLAYAIQWIEQQPSKIKQNKDGQ
jgi:hypothetical protein